MKHLNNASKLTALVIGAFIVGLSVFSSSQDTYYNMSNADQLTVTVDNLDVVNEVMYFAGIEVEVDPNVNASELVYVKEEINLRIHGDRISIIAGDNGEF